MGRGQFAREWHSPAGSIYLSLAYPFDKSLSLNALSLVAGISVCDAIDHSYALNSALKVKWPNDIMADNKKLAGILVEIEQSKSHNIAIIGIGLNVVLPDSASINQPAHALQALTNDEIDYNNLVANTINSLMSAISTYQISDLSGFINAWNKRDYLHDKAISVISGANSYIGTGAGITPEGQIIVRMEDGSENSFASASVKIMS